MIRARARGAKESLAMVIGRPCPQACTPFPPTRYDPEQHLLKYFNLFLRSVRQPIRRAKLAVGRKLASTSRVSGSHSELSSETIVQSVRPYNSIMNESSYQ